jgi:eukaryotic-like serine/threonine-protein kinase
MCGAALAAVGLLSSLSVHFRETPLATRTSRFQVPLPEKTTAPIFQLSPDGRYLAVTAAEGSQRRLWVRPLDALDAQALSGTDDATFPFWSPDSAFVAFFAQGKLKKIALTGGPPQTLCDAPQGRGGAWSSAGVILFASLGSALFRVPATGGIPAPATTAAHADESHRYPTFLPSGTRFLYVVQGGTPRTNGIYVGSLDGRSPVRLRPDVSRAVYVPPDVVGTTGIFLFRRRDGTLMAQPFDPGGLALAGEMYPIAEHVGLSGNAGNGAFSVSENGVLAYSSGGLGTDVHELVWRDRTGKRLGVVGQPDRISSGVLSPDEKKISFSLFKGDYAEVWLHDVGRGLSSPFTTLPGLWLRSVWSPDGSRIILVEGNSPPSSGLYQKPSNGTGNEELLFREPVGFNLRPLDWSRDGKLLVYQMQSSARGWDLLLLPPEGDRRPVPYLQTPANETVGQFSPDGRWMAYASDESGTRQIYVQAIPANGDKRQISTAGGDQPRWRRDGHELFYIANNQTLMAAPVKTVGTFETDTPRPLFPIDPVNLVGSSFAYQPALDGQRFLVTTPVSRTTPPITVVLNWQAGLKK